jgi:hypothetical protein
MLFNIFIQMELNFHKINSFFSTDCSSFASVWQHWAQVMKKVKAFLSFDACDQSICNLSFHKFYVDLGLLALPSKARIFCLDSL